MDPVRVTNKLRIPYSIPKFKWAINPIDVAKNDLCLYNTRFKKGIINYKTFSPFNINVAESKHYKATYKLFVDINVCSSYSIDCSLLYKNIMQDFDSRKVEQLYIKIRSIYRDVIPNKFIHLYILTAAYIKIMFGRSWNGMLVGKCIRSHELGKYMEAGTEKDFIKKLKKYLAPDSIIQTSHTYPFMLAYIYYNQPKPKT